MGRVLVLSSEPVGARMAGPAIRACELGRVLASAGHGVTLGAPEGPERVPAPLEPVDADDRRAVRALARAAEVTVVQGWALERNPGLSALDTRLVVDLYDPFALELLSLLGARPAPERARGQANALRALHDQLRAGDFFLCASERQRDYWLGWLEAAGRVNPLTHAADPSLRALLDVVPFGVPAEPPARAGPGPRERFGIGPEAVLLLWGGGVYDWFDPVTVVRAAGEVEGVHVVFMAGGHPNPGLPVPSALQEARRVGGGRVHFHDSWVPYDERASWLLDADVGVSAHRDDVEARLAFRTRVLDYLWAGLPVLCTAGDALADEVERAGLGATLPPGDVEAWAAAIEGLARDPQGRAECAQRSAGAARALTWERVSGPLTAFCATPRRAPDRAAGGILRPTRDRPWSRRRVAQLARRLRLRR